MIQKETLSMYPWKTERFFLLQRPIPKGDHSALEVYIEGDGEVFTVLQASGNEFSVPWDVIQTIAIGKKKEQTT